MLRLVSSAARAVNHVTSATGRISISHSAGVHNKHIMQHGGGGGEGGGTYVFMSDLTSEG